MFLVETNPIYLVSSFSRKLFAMIFWKGIFVHHDNQYTDLSLMTLEYHPLIFLRVPEFQHCLGDQWLIIRVIHNLFCVISIVDTINRIFYKNVGRINRNNANNHIPYLSLFKGNLDKMKIVDVNQKLNEVITNHLENADNKMFGNSTFFNCLIIIDIQYHTLFQLGGVILQSINEIAHKVCRSGKGPLNIGYWSYIRYRGRNNISLRVVIVYCPCSQSKAGIQTLFS